MSGNNDERQLNSPHKEQPWWIKVFVVLYAMFWLTMIFASGMNSLYLGEIDIASVSMAFSLTIGLYPLIKILEKM